MRSVTFTSEIRAESTDLYPVFDFNVNKKREDQLLLGKDIPGLSLGASFHREITLLIPVYNCCQSNPPCLKVFKISAPQRSHQLFCNPRQNSSPSPYTPLPTPHPSEDRELIGGGNISENAVVGKRFSQGLGKEEACMQEGH